MTMLDVYYIFKMFYAKREEIDFIDEKIFKKKLLH